MSENVLFCFAIILAVCQGNEAGNIAEIRQINDISELTFLERFHLLLTSKTNPHYKDLPIKVSDLLLAPRLPYLYNFFDNTYLDLGGWVLQSRHWGDNIPVPEINWKYGISFCLCFFGNCFCVDQAHLWTSENSQFLGTDTIQMKTDWTPSTFVHRYMIGNYTWWSPNAQTVEEDFINGGTVTCTGAWAKVENVTMLIGGTYNHDETLGLQIDTLTFEFKVGNVSIGQNGCFARYNNGTEGIKTDPFVADFTESLLESFEEERLFYLWSLRARINCALSEGKYVPPPPPGDEEADIKCDFEKDSRLEHFTKATTLQLFQMMAAGAHE